MKVSFNQPHFTGKETLYIEQAVRNKKISGNGDFTKKCQDFFQEEYAFKKCFLTTSCTDALEMAALLLDLNPGDEVIMPTFTFVSTANAFLLRGAVIRFADSLSDHPNIDPAEIRKLISPKTKAIVVVHYAGVACDMDSIIAMAEEHNLWVIEDAAQAIDSYHYERPLGSIGHLAAFSFHETKNIGCGEGGMLVVNHPEFLDRAEIIWEKGTNRSAFWRGEVDKYTWKDLGSSFLPSEVTAAILWAQLEELKRIQQKRKSLWGYYNERLQPLQEKGLDVPNLPQWASQNAHMFYLVAKDHELQQRIIEFLNTKGISAVFHYITLHDSPFYHERHDGRVLANAKRFSECLFRLPMFYDLDQSQQDYIIDGLFEATSNL